MHDTLDIYPFPCSKVSNDLIHCIVIHLYIIPFQIIYFNCYIPELINYFIAVIMFYMQYQFCKIKSKNNLHFFYFEELPLHQLLEEFFSHQSAQPNYGFIIWTKSIQTKISMTYFLKIYFYS